MKLASTIAIGVFAIAMSAADGKAFAQGMSCAMSGPQAPRDIQDHKGSNPVQFPLAKAAQELSLCNIHFHANAEHKGPGFIEAADAGSSGYKCSGEEAKGLTAAELKAPESGACRGFKPGDTIEVHWVYSSCGSDPGAGLGQCTTCPDPMLRVEAQVFLVVNNATDPKVAKFTDFAHAGKNAKGLHQVKALPGDTGDPVVFRGSTTGPTYSDQSCSANKVTWSVRPNCARIDINSLESWCAANPFKDDNHAHGARPLVTTEKLLAPIQQ